MNARDGNGVGAAGRLIGAGLLGVFCMLACAGQAWADVPDNRDVRFNPDDPVSPAYDGTLQERDEQRLKEALEEGGSFVKTVHGPARASHGSRDLPEGYRHDSAAIDTAAQELPAEARRPAPVYESAALPPAHGTDGETPRLTESGLAAMIAVLLESWTRPPDIVRLRYAAPEGGDGGAARGAAAPEPAERDRAGLPRIAAGQGFYARTLYAVNSDYPGPVVLELLQPPLRGAVAHGGFERAGQRLVLRLASLTWQGRTYPVDAWAVDPECACYGVRGEVDRHFFSRVLLPAAARFAEGFLTAAAMPARTLTLQDGAVLHERGAGGEREAFQSGLGAAARTFGDIFTSDAPREATVRIPRNTPLVVMVARHFAAAPDAAAPDRRRRERADAGN